MAARTSAAAAVLLGALGALWVVAALAALAALSEAADPAPGRIRCADNSRSCSSNKDCCSGCCAQGACASYDRCSAATLGACAVHTCPPEKECYLQQVQCITAPCPPIPACRPKDYDYNY